MSRNHNNKNQLSWIEQISGPLHERILWLFMIIVLGHWIEHVSQIYQVYVMGWLPADAGGALGLWFPSINKSEVLHFTYNGALWGGLLILRFGFRGRSRSWWNAALIAQSWHFFEHFLLQVQWLTGIYLFGASKQISILELWFPRMELHFAYNLIVFVPMVIAMLKYSSPSGHHRNTRASDMAHAEFA